MYFYLRTFVFKISELFYGPSYDNLVNMAFLLILHSCELSLMLNVQSVNFNRAA